MKNESLQDKALQTVNMETIQECSGIYQHEIWDLSGRDLTTDESGHLCIRGRVRNWRILPGCEDRVKAVFAGVDPNSPVFPDVAHVWRDDMEDRRKRVIQKAYYHYAQELAKNPDLRAQYKDELRARYKAVYPMETPFGIEFWLLSADRSYYLEAEDFKRALFSGLPTEYNGLALMMASCFYTFWCQINSAIPYLIS